MIGLQPYPAKAAAAVERHRAAVARAETAIAEKETSRPIGDDEDAIFEWKRDRRDLDDRLEAAREALDWAEARAAEAAEAEAARQADAAHLAEEKRAKSDTKLAERAETAIAAAYAAIAALAESNARTLKYNRNSGRPPIATAEARWRTSPARTVPGEFRDLIVWRNSAGEQPHLLTASGEPIGFGFTKRTERRCTREEQKIPPQTPRAYIDSITLVDREGNKLRFD